MPDPQRADPQLPALHLSVVVAVRGNPRELPGLLTALHAQQELPAHSIEVLIVDNHDSPCPALATIAGDQPAPGVPVPSPVGSVVVLHEPRVGLSRARNRGIRCAHSRYVLITDPDARPSPTWAARMVEALETTNAYCVGGRVEPHHTGPTPAHLSPDIAALFTPPAWPSTVEVLRDPYWLVGCSLGIRTEPLPVFDEAFGVRGRRALTCEDLEFVARCQRDALAVVIAPGAVLSRAIHPSDLTPRALLRRGFGHGVAMTRLTAAHPDIAVLDSYHLSRIRRLWKTDRMGALVAAARIAGRLAERIRQTLDIRADAIRAGTPRPPHRAQNQDRT